MSHYNNSLNLPGGTNGQVLVAATNSTPSFATLSSSGGTISYTTGANTLNIDGTAATTSQAGVTAYATGAQAIAGTSTTTAVTPSSLGSKLGNQTAHGVLVGEGTTSALTSLAVGTNGQVLVGSTGADPVFATLTSSDSTITFTAGAGTLSLQAVSGGQIWTATASNQTLAPSGSWISTKSGTVTFTLPATSAVGDMYSILNGSATAAGWTIAQNAGQNIQFGNISTTSGTGGSLSSSATGDCITLVAIVASTTWGVVSSIGNITYV